MKNREIRPAGPYMSIQPLILASGSPRRRQLLAEAGLDFQIKVSKVEEPAPLTDESPRKYAERMAQLKAWDVASRNSKKTILSADTIVVLEKQIMGKPASTTEALHMLQTLSGNTHQVITGCCLILPSSQAPIAFSVKTDVLMRQSKREELEGYIASGESMDKAGAYAIQGMGGFMVRAIRGSYSNVVGLPLAEVLDILIANKVIASKKIKNF